MIEKGGLPGGSGMTLGAVRTKLSMVGIIASVTAKAVLWCAFELAVFVAGKTGNVDVCAIEFESGQVVVKRGWLPGGSAVAFGAICAKLSMMGIILGMASVTLRGRTL